MQQSNQNESSSNFLLDWYNALLDNWTSVVELSIFTVKHFVSILCSDTDCPDWRYSWIYWVIPDN